MSEELLRSAPPSQAVLPGTTAAVLRVLNFHAEQTITPRRRNQTRLRSSLLLPCLPPRNQSCSTRKEKFAKERFYSPLPAATEPCFRQRRLVLW